MKTTNSKVIAKLQEHILDGFGLDYGYDNDNKVENLRSQVENLDYNNRGQNAAIRDLIEGGKFLVYYFDCREFLNSLGINPDNKEYTDTQVWERYIQLLTREISRLLTTP